MSSIYYYKGTDIYDMISTGTSTISGYDIKYNSTTNKYDALDADSGVYATYLSNNDSISNIQAKSTKLTSNGSITIPEWCDSFKIYIKTAKGEKGGKGAKAASGAKGDTGDTGDGGKSQKGQQKTGQGGDGGAGGQGGDGGAGGAGGTPGDGGAGIIAYTERIYKFNNKSNINCQFDTDKINISLPDTINITANYSTKGYRSQDGKDGVKGEKGGKGGRGQDGQGGHMAQNPHHGAAGGTGAKGSPGSKGASGDIGSKGASGDIGQISIQGSPFTTVSTTESEKSVTVYFFKT